MSDASDAMLDALSAEELAIVHAFALARTVERTHVGALDVFLDRVGDEAALWAARWSSAWARARWTMPDISALDLVDLLPESLRAGAAARLANPIFTDREEAKEAFMMNRDLLRRGRPR